MPDCEGLLRKAQNDPRTLKFRELCQLAECLGSEYARQKGSHVIYKRPGYIGLMNFQNHGGDAKAYQVRQLLRVAEDLDLI